MIEKIEIWLPVVTAAIGAITTIITIIANNKKKNAQKMVELAKVVQKLPEFINEAETIFGSGTGTAKMAYVLNKVQMACMQNNVEFNENQFKVEIEKILNTPTTIKKGESNEQN